MIMQYEILYTDLDGTLLNSNKEISEDTMKAIHEMLTRGKKLVLASGRPLHSILERKNTLGIPNHNVYITAFNGSQLYDCEQDKIIEEYRVPMDTAQQIFDLAHERNIHIHTFQDKSVISCADDKELAYYTTYVPSDVIINQKLSAVMKEEPFKLLAIDLEEPETKRLAAFKEDVLSSPLGEKISSVFSHATYLEFFRKDAGKGNGLIHLCNYLQIPVEASISVGDEENDISMILAAGLGVAMKNAVPALKEKASYITENDNDHNAIAEIITKFIF